MQKHRPNMGIKTAPHNQEQGFITLIIFLLIVLIAVLALVYLRVAKAQH